MLASLLLPGSIMRISLPAPGLWLALGMPLAACSSAGVLTDDGERDALRSPPPTSLPPRASLPPTPGATDAAAAPPVIEADAGLAPPPPPPADPCQGVDYLGLCEGAVAVWCEDGSLQREDCGLRGQGCGWVDNTQGYFCGGQGAEPQPGGDPVVPPGGGAGCGEPLEAGNFALVNQARAQAGAGALSCDDAATRAARAHSQDMCDRGYFDHTGLDGSDTGDRLNRQSARYNAWGENIAMGTATAADTHDLWMNSPGHRRNILDNTFGRLGVGHAPCAGQHYWTQVFMD